MHAKKSVTFTPRHWTRSHCATSGGHHAGGRPSVARHAGGRGSCRATSPTAREVIAAGLLAAVLLATGCGERTSGVAANRSQIVDLRQLRTKAERTDYVETDRYDDVIAICRQLAASSELIEYRSFGTSGEGRELPLLVVSNSGDFTPEAHRASGKLGVLVINCIHAGECSGKDASLELVRDIATSDAHRRLLDHVNLLIVPIFNTDGHERFGPFNRINQNGPKEMGWRVTAQNLNLNRDFAKADAPEMQAWLRTWNEWDPDLFFDDHTTDGSDHQYTLYYAATNHELVAPPIAAWMNDALLADILPKLEAAGHNPFPYGGPRDRQDLSKGIVAYGTYSPRFSTGYGAVCNRPSILVEVHSFKPYAKRVRATYDMLRLTLEQLNRDPSALREAIREADALTVQNRGAHAADAGVVISQEPVEEGEPITYKSVEFSVRESSASGSEIVEYSDRPLDVQTMLYAATRVKDTIQPPAAYVVPPQWWEVIRRLELHGIEFFRLAQAETLEVESYRFEDVEFAKSPYEGRFSPNFKAVETSGPREFAAGSVVIPMNQRRAKLVVHLLEPAAADSLLRWGFFNVIFERKEYFEDYVMAPIGERMLAEDAELRREFEEKLAADEEFAKNPRARLEWLYVRSPYCDQRHNVYPVGRLMDAEMVDGLRNAGHR